MITTPSALTRVASFAVDIKREHQPQRDGEDLFMPAQPYDQEAGSVPRLPPLDPALVAGEAAEQKEQEAEGDLPQAGRWRRRARPGSSAGSGPLGSLSRWSDMPLLDRRAVEDKLVRELAAQVGGGARGERPSLCGGLLSIGRIMRLYTIKGLWVMLRYCFRSTNWCNGCLSRVVGNVCVSVSVHIADYHIAEHP